MMGALQHQIVAPAVRPIIGFAVADEQHARMGGLHVVEERYLNKSVEHIALLKGRSRLIQTIQKRLRWRRGGICRWQRCAGLNIEVTAGRIEDFSVSMPTPEDRYLAGQVRALIEPFEYVQIRVGTLFVFADSRIGVTGRHLAVSGIGSAVRIRHLSDAAEPLIAEYLPLLGHHVPQEREQQLAAVQRIIVPEPFPEAGFGLPNAAVLLIEKARVRAGERL